MNDWIVVGSYQNEIEALIAKGALEAAGINCRARLNENGDAMLGGMGLLGGATEILVAPKDGEKAQQILKA